jgi:hypothetical protein
VLLIGQTVSPKSRINTNFEGWTVVFEFLDKIVGPPCRWDMRLLAPLRLVRGVREERGNGDDKQWHPLQHQAPSHVGGAHADDSN